MRPALARAGPLEPRAEAAGRLADTADLDEAERVLPAALPRLEAEIRGCAVPRLGLAVLRPELTAPRADLAVRLGLAVARSGLAMLRPELTPPIVDLAGLRTVELAALRGVELALLRGVAVLRLGLAVPRLEPTPPRVDAGVPLRLRAASGRDSLDDAIRPIERADCAAPDVAPRLPDVALRSRDVAPRLPASRSALTMPSRVLPRPPASLPARELAAAPRLVPPARPSVAALRVRAPAAALRSFAARTVRDGAAALRRSADAIRPIVRSLPAAARRSVVAIVRRLSSPRRT